MICMGIDLWEQWLSIRAVLDHQKPSDPCQQGNQMYDAHVYTYKHGCTYIYISAHTHTCWHRWFLAKCPFYYQPLYSVTGYIFLWHQYVLSKARQKWSSESYIFSAYFFQPISWCIQSMVASFFFCDVSTTIIKPLRQDRENVSSLIFFCSFTNDLQVHQEWGDYLL